MFVIVAGGGKVGANVARSLIGHGHEVALIEQRPFRFARLEDELEHGLVHLLELRKEDLDIVEVQVDESSPCVGKRVSELKVPEGATVIAVMREGRAEGPDNANVLAPGDQVLAVLRSGKEEDLRKLLLKPAK